jgi:hypothetical protein
MGIGGDSALDFDSAPAPEIDSGSHSDFDWDARFDSGFRSDFDPVLDFRHDLGFDCDYDWTVNGLSSEL